ncbi:hypothetical protein FRC12_022627, partial [Ceratobasidium sp. 428]
LIISPPTSSTSGCHATSASDLAERLAERATTEDSNKLESQDSSDGEFKLPATSSKIAKSASSKHDALLAMQNLELGFGGTQATSIDVIQVLYF